MRYNDPSVDKPKIQLSTAKFHQPIEGSINSFNLLLLSIYHQTGLLSDQNNGQLTVKDCKSVFVDCLPKPTSLIFFISYTFKGSYISLDSEIC